MQLDDQRKYLQRATDLAEYALTQGSNPIGAVIVNSNGEIISEGYNEIKIINDVTAHGEIVALRKAGKQVMKKFNPSPTYLFTTLEPCFACGFFVTRTNIQHIVWALDDPYNGGINFLKDTHKLMDAFKNIVLTSEPFEDLRKRSQDLTRKWYEDKNEFKIAKFFTDSDAR